MKKIVGIFVCMLLVATALSVAGTRNTEQADLCADVAPEKGVIPSGAGDFPILYEFPITGDNHCVGVGFDGTNFWVSAGDGTTGQCTFYLFDETGALLDSAQQGGGASGWGHRDMAWNGMDMFGSFSSDINGFSDIFTHDGFFVGPISPNRAMAFDGTYFYTCGFSEMLYRLEWDGNWGSTATATALSGPWSGCYGLAYDAVFDCLWMTTADYTGTLYQLDMAGNILNTFTTLPEYDIQGGCTMADTSYGYVLAVLQQHDVDTVTFYEVHPEDVASIDIEKQVNTPVIGAEYTLCLEDDFGDGWNGGWLNVSVNDVLLYENLTIEYGAGPECYPIIVDSGDTIFVDYTYGDWSYENIWYLTDHLGVEVFYEVGSDDNESHDHIVVVPAGALVDADDPESAVDWEICTIVQFTITIHNDGDFPLYEIIVDDIMHDSLEIVDWDWQPEYLTYDPPFWHFGWVFPGPLNPCETITINIWAHVWGPHCSIDENFVQTTAWSPETQEWVMDEDSAFIHCRDPCHIDVEKYVWVPGDPCNYQICLEDTYGDSWGTAYLDVYVNGDLVLSGITCPAAGPDCFDIPVEDGDVIEVYYWDPDPWPYENYFYVKDCDGNVVADAWGEDPTDPEPEIVVIVEIGEWVDADTENEAVDLPICTNATFMITIHNDGMCTLEDIWVYDWFSESLEFVDADPYPTYIEPGYLEWTDMGWDLMHCEWIYIYITFHVVGPACTPDENLGAADGWCPCEGIYVGDEDSAWIHPIEGDTTPPVTTHELDGTMGENDWFISDVTITLTAEDDDSGVDFTMISIDGGAFEEYTAPVVVSDDGEHEFEYYSVDNAGNEEPVNGPFDFKIDQTPPTIELTSEKLAFNKWLFTADCDDATSGMDKVEFYLSIDGGAFTLEDTVTSPPYEYEYTGLQNITVKAIAFDNAGLSSEDTAALSTTEFVLQHFPIATKTTETRGN
jgi:hypothetical protein